MMQTTATLPAAVDVDEARAVVAAALARYAETTDDDRERSIAREMAGNVQGWTHTTRLRDYARKIPALLVEVL